MEESGFYQSVIENTLVGYSYNKIIYNDNGDPQDYEFVEVNEAYELMLGIEGKDWVEKRISELYKSIKKNKDNWDEFHSKHFVKLAKEGSENIFTYRGKHYRVKLHPLKKDYVIISLTDVSREVEETEKVRVLFDNVPIQVWYLNEANHYISANKVHADFIGLKSEEMVSKNLKDFFTRGESETCISGNKKVFKEKRRVVREEWIADSYGEKRLLRITKNPKLNSKGKIEFVICSAEDITQEYINKEQNEMQEKILYSSMDFTKELLTNDNLDEALSNGMKMLGNATKVDRVYYWENHYDEVSKKWLSSQKIEWCLDDVDSQIDNPDLQNVPFEESIDFLEFLAQNQSFSYHVKDMEDGDNTTKQTLKDQGILSILIIPVFVKTEFIGFIGFDSCKIEKEWSQVEISLLNSFVLLYAEALEKNDLEQEVKQTGANFFNFFNMIQDLLIVLDYDGTIIDVNKNVLERLNYTRDELWGESYLMLHPEDTKEETKSNFNDLITQKTEYFKMDAVTKDGYVFPVESMNTEGLWNGKPAIFSVTKDVTELSLSEDKFSKAFNNSGVSMFISKFADGEILEANDTFLSYVGYTENEVIGKTTLDLEMTKDYENRDLFIEQIKTEGKISDLEIKFISKDNKVRTGLTNIVPITINNEACLLSSIVDISDRIENEKKILELSNRDELTNLYNRRFIYESVEEIIADYKENNEPFSVAILDIDNFKGINDQYGHQIGDCVLVKISKVINESLREYDILGRYGGEEFIILLNHADIEKSNLVLGRILNIVQTTIFTCGGNQIELTFSAGLTSCVEIEKDELSIDKLVGISDKRMYLAKQNGKNRIVYRG